MDVYKTKTRIILDACVLSSWLLEEPEKNYSDKVFTLISSRTVFVTVPALFYDETLNILLKALIKKRINISFFNESIKTLLLFSKNFNTIPIVFEDITFERKLSLARKHNLRSYDAIYLDLALTQHCKLATLDQRLSRAAQTENCFFQA